MKLSPIYASLFYLTTTLAAADNTQNIESIIQDALSKIITRTKTGFKISIQPYIAGEVFLALPSKNIGFDGTLGTVGVQTFYDRETCDVTVKTGVDQGLSSIHDFPAYNYIFPEFMWDYTLSVEHKLELPCFNGEAAGFPLQVSYSSSGSVNGASFDNSFSLGLDSFTMTPKKYILPIVFEGNSHFSPDFPGKLKPAIPESFMFQVTASARIDCIKNPFSKKCSADIDITSSINKVELPVTNFSWKGKTGKFSIKYGQNIVFKIRVNYGTYWKISYMCDEIICGKFANGYYTTSEMSHLITVPSDKAIPDITDAFLKFTYVYRNLYVELTDEFLRSGSYERFGQFILYFDRFSAVLVKDMDAFDCSGLVQASGFEWPALANYLGAESVQSYGKAVCKGVNAKSEAFLVERVAPGVLGGRTFLRKVLEKNSEESFGEWTTDVLTM